MFWYYIIPVRRTGRGLRADPSDINALLTHSLHDVHDHFGTNGESLFAVWVLTPYARRISVEQAKGLCATSAPHRIYIALRDRAIFPLDLDPALYLTLENEDARANR